MATAATTGGSSREARRRRIMERGSDRLALITGHIKSLPPDTDQSPSSTFIPAQTPADFARHEDAASNSSLPDQESSIKSDQESSIKSEQHHVLNETVEPMTHNSNESRSITTGAVALHDTKEEISQISSSLELPAQDHQREQSNRNSLTTGQISSAIADSENIRMCCSVAAAILVILSYMGFPVLGFRGIKSIIIFRPMYLLLLTNISIVLGRVILGTQPRTGRTSSVPTVNGNALVDQLGKTLELVLLLQKIFGALFVDFSIYAVVLVSGLSLVRRLGW